MQSNLKRNLLLLEVNEVPWQVIDKFKADSRFPNIKKFFSNAKTYTPISVDGGELSPWIVWPSFHRGIDSEKHNIRFIGQDTSTYKGVPIWEVFRERGYNIGVVGPFHSWPIKDPGEGGFYIPDTFAHDEKCYPEYVEPLQRFNLDLVGKNGRVIREITPFTKHTIPLLYSLPRLGISRSLVLSLFKQLVAEKVNKKYYARRRIFQSLLVWDVFKKLFNASVPPAYSTCFSNHMASTMHRYWHSFFPEEFKGEYLNSSSENLSTVLFALKVLDSMLGDVMNFCKLNPKITPVFASATGQAAVYRRGYYEGIDAAVSDVSKLMDVIGVNKLYYKPLLAMVPQVAIEVEDKNVRSYIKRCLQSCRTSSGKSLFIVDEEGKSISIWIYTPSLKDINLNKFMFNKSENVICSASWEQAGISMHKVEPPTAYHIPEGIVAIYGEGIKPNDSREEIKATEAKTLFLDLAFKGVY